MWSQRSLVRRSFLRSETVKKLSLTVNISENESRSKKYIKADLIPFKWGVQIFSCEFITNPVDIGPTKICALDPNNKIDACQVKIGKKYLSNIYKKTLTCGKTIQGDSGGPLVVLKRDTNEGLRCKFEMSRLVLKARFQHFIISRSILFGWGCFFWIQVRGTGKNSFVRIKNPFFCKILYQTEFYPPTQSLSRKVDTSLSSVKC